MRFDDVVRVFRPQLRRAQIRGSATGLTSVSFMEGNERVQNQAIGSPSAPYVVSLGRRAEGERVGGDVRVEGFATHPLLQSAVPGEAVAFSWVRVPPGGAWSVEAQKARGLLIVLEGRASLLGAGDRIVERGDVATLPPGQSYEIVDQFGTGLSALEVRFDPGVATDTTHATAGRLSPPPVEAPFTLEGLLAKNEALAEEVLKNPYFRMIQEGGLDTEETRGLFRDRLRVFCDAFQTFLFARQATCADESYKGVFVEHLMEEIGHNDLMKVTGNKRRFDAVLEATSNWFCHQMLVQDNVGKAAIHLVLETGGDYFHNLAKPAFDADVSAEYFKTHAEDDERHKQMSIDLLGGQTSATYERLEGTVADAWHMIDAMTRRIYRLVQSERGAS